MNMLRFGLPTARLLLFILYCLFPLPVPAQQTQTTESEPPEFEPAPVVLEGETIFTIRAGLKYLTPQQRAENTTKRILAIASDYTVQVEDLKIVETDISTDIATDQHLAALFTDADAKAEGKTRQALAKETLPKIQMVILHYRQAHSRVEILKSVGESVLATLALILSAVFIGRFFRKMIRFTERKLRFGVASESKIHTFAGNLLRTTHILVLLVLAYFYLHTTLALFPWTRAISIQLLSYILSPLKTMGTAFLNKIPDLLFLFVLTVVFYHFLKFLKLFFYLIESGKFSITGFFPEWAKPTYRIVRAVVIGFALVVAFPYVPGSDSEAFKGISIFAGILISLGSTSAISNVIAGTILTYMRPYKIGDWVMIGEVMGVVTEMSFLVTRVHTPKNEEIAISNSIVLGREITNYSNLARKNGLIIHTSVTIGYGAPWKKVHELLISAALATEWIQPEPAPFVLQTALNDFYVAYQINAYTDVPARSDHPQDLQVLYSNLHKNIQDKFNEGGVEIMSPHYYQLRDGNELAVPASYVPRDHVPSALRVLVDKVTKPEK